MTPLKNKATPQKLVVGKAPAKGVDKAKAAKAAVEKAAKEAADRKSAVWPKLMMTSHTVLESYAKKTHDIWRTITPRSSKIDVIKKLGRVLDDIHCMCGIPKIKHSIFSLASTNVGGFNMISWEMRINEMILQSNITKLDFYRLVETLYHEGRHAEQAWLVRVQSIFRKRKWSPSLKKYELPGHVKGKLSFNEPGWVFDKALIVALSRGAEPEVGAKKEYAAYTALTKKIKKWEESMTKNVKDVLCIHMNMGTNPHWYHKYQTLPMEYDAFLLEEKLREEFKKIRDFKDTAIQAAPPPCAHCHRKNNKHVISGLPLDKVRGGFMFDIEQIRV